MRAPKRAAALVGLAVVLLAGGLADRARRPGPGSDAAFSVAARMPTAAPPGALSATWYCPANGAGAASPLNGTIIVANPTGLPVHGTLTVVPAGGGAGASAPVEVGPASASSVVLAGLTTATYAGVVVQLDGGQVVVEHKVAGPAGANLSPCASASSDRWYFADGSTARDATLLLALFNPFPEDAIVDLSFVTDQGSAVPSDFQGVVVPGRGLVMIDVGEHVRRREWVATQVSVRSGRLVAEEAQERTAPGRAGLSLTLGAPSAGGTWYFPDGLASATVAQRLSVFNPTNREARVEVAVSLDKGSAEPFELTVPANDRAALQLDRETRIPKNAAFSAIARSTNGVPVVVQRVVEIGAGPHAGRADSTGARRAVRRWALAAGAATPAIDEWIVLQNVSARPATVSIVGLADGQEVKIEGLQGLRVPAGARRAYRLGDHVQRDPLPVVVRSSTPVVVERALFNPTGAGVNETMGIPLD